MTSIRQPNVLPVFDRGEGGYQLAESGWGCDTIHGFIELPLGFIMDLASVPRLLWWLYPPDGPYRAAALMHDWLYASKGRVEADGAGIVLTRKECDAVFLDVMLRSPGMSANQAGEMWAAVRMCGWWAWHTRRKPPLVEPLRYIMNWKKSPYVMNGFHVAAPTVWS